MNNITEKDLKKIILEEYNRILSEMGDSMGDDMAVLNRMEGLMAECDMNPGGEACAALQAMASDATLEETKLHNIKLNGRDKRLLNEVLVETGILLSIGKLVIDFALMYGMHHVYRGVDWAWEKVFGEKPLLGKGLTGMPVIDNYGFAKKILAWLWGEKEKTPKEKRAEKLKQFKDDLKRKMSEPPESTGPDWSSTDRPDAAKYDWDTRDSHRQQEFDLKDPLMERWNRIVKNKRRTQ